MISDLPGFAIPLVGIYVPPDLDRCFGYIGDRRFVAFWWEIGGDELAYSDGRSWSVGINWWAWKTYLEHPRIAPFFLQADLGASDAEARQVLLMDRRHERLALADKELAICWLQEMWKEEMRDAMEEPPVPEPAHLDAIVEQIRAKIDTNALMRHVDEDRRRVQRLKGLLDENA